jgi:ABC-type sugar transport system permease subunit
MKKRESLGTGLASRLTRLVVLMLVDAMASLFVMVLIRDGYWQLAVIVIVITLLLNIVFLREDAYPLRWISPGLSFMLLLSVYPIVFTIYMSFTNYGTGHLLPKVQAIEVMAQRQFLPEEGVTYEYTVFKSENETFALWLQPDEGDGLFAQPTEGDMAITVEIGDLDEDGVPATVSGYERLDKVQTMKSISDLQGISFGEPPNVVQITAQFGKAAALEQRYMYDSADDTMLDRKTDNVYQADSDLGYFVSEDGEQLLPGYITTVGLLNFQRFFTNPSFRGPLLRIFIWTFAYALLTVFLSFSLGLVIALAFGRNIPGEKLLKGAFIIPYAIPAVITVLVWRGLLNPLEGPVSVALQSIFNQPPGWPPFFADPWWVKIGIIIVSVWMSYPYHMLINSGALKAIPDDIYEAAEIDGANAWQQFRAITLPLLLVGVGPLLLAGFTFAFNSIGVVYLFNDGGPPMVGTATPAGHSDILVSYVYRLAFTGGTGQQYGYAAAISMVIFSIVATITMLQWGRIRAWEEVGENV